MDLGLNAMELSIINRSMEQALKISEIGCRWEKA